LPTFKVTGRVLDDEKGKPVPKFRYGVYRSHEHGGTSSRGNDVTNVNGEFRLENVLPGKYAVFIAAEGNAMRGDSVSFEVVDRDIADLVIKAGKAASVSGVVVFEGVEETTIKPNTLLLHAWSQSNEERFSGTRPQPLNPDGSFTISGLRKGFAGFSLTSRDSNDTRVALVRIERDGVVQPQGFPIKDGEQVTGLRLIARYLTGAIQGQIKVENDEPLPSSQISVWINSIDSSRPGEYNASGGSSTELDSRKRFVVRGLAPGMYEVNAAVFEPNRQDTTRTYKQQVMVADNTVSEVTITIKKP
jgi:hypothetical protein